MRQAKYLHDCSDPEVDVTSIDPIVSLPYDEKKVQILVFSY